MVEKDNLKNNQEEAIEYYQKVIELDPTTTFAKDAQRSLVHIEKSRAAMERVCEIMKKAKLKSRVTYYYLLATELKKAKKYIEG